jgi:L-aspartate oxidase
MNAETRSLPGPIIIGAGVAGLMTALRLAPEPVALLSRRQLGADCSSAWAQGGLAASMGPDDEPALHCADTLAAGDGLCDAAVVRAITRAAPGAIEELVRLGVRFDRAEDGALALGLEAAHRRRRIVHAAGDGTGRELMRALIEAVRRTPSITVMEGLEARRLLVDQGRVVGVLAASPAGALRLISSRIVIASGGIGGLFTDTTNSDGCFGQGLALAARAGAAFSDLEFIQFHPTALATRLRPAPLVSEAVRGEGAILVDETGRRFLADEPGAELAPRDVVARGVWRCLAEGHTVYLDARRRPGAQFAGRFPAIAALCGAAGIDPARQLIPIRPAAHYHMGGIDVDLQGRSSIPGLWACGEVACTGLHGANRLASNSLIEAVVCAGFVAESIAGAAVPPPPRRPTSLKLTEPRELPSASNPAAVRSAVSQGLGVLRDEVGLRATIAALLPLADSGGQAADPALVALMLAVAAWRRRERRGAHWRTDCVRSQSTPARSSLRLEQALAAAREIEAQQAPAPVARTA